MSVSIGGATGRPDFRPATKFGLLATSRPTGSRNDGMRLPLWSNRLPKGLEKMDSVTANVCGPTVAQRRPALHPLPLGFSEVLNIFLAGEHGLSRGISDYVALRPARPLPKGVARATPATLHPSSRHHPGGQSGERCHYPTNWRGITRTRTELVLTSTQDAAFNPGIVRIANQYPVAFKPIRNFLTLFSEFQHSSQIHPMPFMTTPNYLPGRVITFFIVDNESPKGASLTKIWPFSCQSARC